VVRQGDEVPVALSHLYTVAGDEEPPAEERT
jgi:hypothetical protein